MSLVLDSVSKRVGGLDHVADISLAMAPGSLNVLLGPTLAGKTSLMRLMAGLDRPTAGRVLMGGRDVTGVPVRRRKVAMVYQQFINYPTLSVFENIASPLRVAGVARAEIERRVGEAARLMRLEPMLARTPAELSGGQQQRTAIARALVKDAELVLLDEPLANLDYKLREELREELPRIFAASGAIFVYATTEPTEALLLGGHTATLHEGRVTQFGPTLEVYRQPVDRRTAEVFSDPPMNFVAARVERGIASLADGTALPPRGALAGLADGPVTLGFRPGHLGLARGGPNGGPDGVAGGGSDAVPVAATVTIVEITGSESFVHLTHRGDGAAGGGGDEEWVALAHGVHELAPGTAIQVYLDPARMFVFGPDGRLLAAPRPAVAA